MTNDPEIYAEVMKELGYGPDSIEPPHEHTIHIPGCVRCDLAAEETKSSAKRKVPANPPGRSRT